MIDYKMNTLSVILPIHNGARYLRRNVEMLLDLLPQMTDEFQIIIVDDGSTDATGDIASDLALSFSQISVMFHGVTRGENASIESGMNLVQHELTFVQATEQIEERKIRSFVRHGGMPPAKADPQELNAEDLLVERLMKWGMALREYRSKSHPDLAPVEESYDETATPELLATVESETFGSEPTEPDTEISNSVPSPKYASVAEKRLMKMSHHDLSRGEYVLRD